MIYATILVVNLIMYFPLADDWKSDQIRWKNDAVHLLPNQYLRQFVVNSIYFYMCFTDDCEKTSPPQGKV